MTNSLANRDKELNTAVNSFITQVLGNYSKTFLPRKLNLLCSKLACLTHTSHLGKERAQGMELYE
jgi:hypothetical protein